MKKTIILTSLLLLAGCETQYRYFCQDPENWEKAECQKPLCEVNRDCPEHIFKNVAPVDSATPATPPKPTAAPKGAC
jgi:hypothetical protein